MSDGQTYKVKQVLRDGKSSAFRTYRAICYGTTSLWYVVKSELLVTLISGIAGGLGLAMRQRLYPCLFRACGRKVIFGRNLTLRHAHKITLGDHVVLDDNVVLDAKGESNSGITIGDNVYVGRNTIVYCKNGDIVLEHDVNVSSNCQIFSSNRVTIGAQSVIAAYTYILGGGQYDYRDKTASFAEQSGMITRGPTTVGGNCWVAAGVVITDGVTVGAHCVIGAGAVVTTDIPPDSLAVGTPAKRVRGL